MASLLKKAARIWRKDGPITLVKRGIRYGYDSWVRPSLPKRVVSYNGVPVLASRLGDSLVPWHTRDIPGYEGTLVEGIQQCVESGDTVVVVGGGWGVSTVVAASQVGEHGQVITYEGGDETVAKVKETVQLNGVSDRVTVRHAVVGQAVSLRSESSGATDISPIDLPECDVLVLDCEGAEKDIIRDMDITPQYVVVETHGLFGAPTSEISDLLSRMGYSVFNRGVANQSKAKFCDSNDIKLLLATEQS